MDASVISKFSIDTQGIVRSASGSFDWLPGSEHDVPVGTSFIDLLPSHLQPAFSLGIGQLDRGERPWFDQQSFTVDTDGSDVALQFHVPWTSAKPILECTVRDTSADLIDNRDRVFRAALLSAQHHVSMDGIVIVSPESEILFWNERYATIWGIPREVMERRSIQAVRAVTSQMVVDPDGVFLEGFQTYDHSRDIAEDELLLRDGRVLLRHSAPVLDKDNSILGRFWSYRDITELRNLQHAAEEQNARLNALVHNNQDIVISIDRHGVIESVNPATVEILKYPEAELRGRLITSLIAEEDQALLQDQIDSAQQGTPEEGEFTATRPDGERAELRIKLIPIDEAGGDGDFWVVASDITEAKHAATEARAAQLALERAQQLTNLGSFEWDLSTNQLIWSPEMYRLLDRDEDPEVPLTVNDFMSAVHPEDREQLGMAIEAAPKSNSTYDIDFRIVLRDGSVRMVRGAGEVVRDHEDTPIAMVGAVLDISEHRRHEEALQQLVDLLEEKTAALEHTTAEQESFIYSVSHDLRSPLISIQGIAEIIQTDYEAHLDDTGRAYLERIHANVRRMQAMLTGLLELSRIGRTEKGSRHAVDLHKLVSEIVDELSGTSSARDAKIEIVDQLPVVQAHYSRMSQLFMNLLDNAIKYTPRNRTPDIVISCETEDNGWKISVKDNGIGIPAEYQSSAVGMFSRLPGGQRLNPNGSGLGLAIVSRIVTTHGGRLWLESAEGEGTRISFTLS